MKLTRQLFIFLIVSMVAISVKAQSALGHIAIQIVSDETVFYDLNEAGHFERLSCKRQDFI